MVWNKAIQPKLNHMNGIQGEFRHVYVLPGNLRFLLVRVAPLLRLLECHIDLYKQVLGELPMIRAHFNAVAHGALILADNHV